MHRDIIDFLCSEKDLVLVRDVVCLVVNYPRRSPMSLDQATTTVTLSLEMHFPLKIIFMNL